MLPSTADPFEVFYTLAGLVGMILAGINFRTAWIEWRANEHHPALDKGKRLRNQIVAGQIVITRAGLVGIQLCVVTLGARAMAVPPNPLVATDWTAWIAGSAVLLSSVFADIVVVSQFISNYRFDRVGRKKITEPLKEKPRDVTE